MTCIIGLSQGGRVYIGADSASASGWSVRATGIQKLFQRGPYLIGYSTSFRMGQILQHEVEYPEAKVYDEHFMVAMFIPAIREKLKLLGYTKIENNQEEAGQFLVGVAGNLFEIGSDFQVNHFQDGMAAVGCGAEYALGALRACLEMEPGLDGAYIRRAIRLALEVSAYFSGGVKEPFEVLEA